MHNQPEGSSRGEAATPLLDEGGVPDSSLLASHLPDRVSADTLAAARMVAQHYADRRNNSLGAQGDPPHA